MELGGVMIIILTSTFLVACQICLKFILFPKTFLKCQDSKYPIRAWMIVNCTRILATSTGKPEILLLNSALQTYRFISELVDSKCLQDEENLGKKPIRT